ncbi:hypothetical protein TNCV_2337861 [Trichonephila clavipes]|nr:hypothetical protein TNCV_2337861 [Trichonephila clavipes]
MLYGRGRQSGGPREHFAGPQKIWNILTHHVKEREAGPYHLRPRNRVAKEAGSNLQEERCKSKGDQSGPKQNYLRGYARTTGVTLQAAIQTPGSRIQGTDDPTVIVQDKVETPGSTIARR